MSSLTKLWAPWRMEYIKNNDKKDSCFLCEHIKNEMIKEPVVAITKDAYAVMNIYPYNPGHIMIVPKKHLGNLEDLNNEELQALSELVRDSVRIIKKTLKPDGINVGLNLGRSAGAGVVDHLHYHVVPRWNGDTNFMPILNETKIISEHISHTYETLREAFKKEGV